VEHVAEMEERVRTTVKFIVKKTAGSEKEALKRVGVIPQCGFASHDSGNAESRQDMINNLKLVSEIVDRTWMVSLEKGNQSKTLVR
jgi:putative N-acetylmannosamine-6-phosphate epimerase